MARIRSVHPGLFTDEAFVSLSDSAQVLFIGLWTECDDQGVFEWKPISIRMRLRPAKDGQIEPLLEELERAQCIRRYELNGRHYGAVRNFLRFQRPKKPKNLYVITPEIGTFVGLKGSSTEPEGVEEGVSTELRRDDDDPVPQKAEMSPQMEDGGGRREEGEEDEGKKREVSKPGRGQNGKHYAFRALHIRLTDDDFNRWQESFPHLSLRAELEGLDAWAGEQGKNWFKAVAGALAKRERQITTQTQNAPSEKRGLTDGIF